ncbi:MAG: putative bifunctional diguanylate cyclase/phosphodiesterase, partial [Acidimicrobiales bacterium]
RIRWANQAFAAVLGRPPAWLSGHPLAVLVHPDERSQIADLLAGRRSASGRPPAEFRLSHLNGEWIPVEALGVDLHDDSGAGGLLVTMRDVSWRQAREEELRHLALHDGLTGLANRELFHDHLAHAFAARRRSAGRQAVLLVDLDGFKTINDSLGHAAGDEVLVTVGERLRSRARPCDTVARLGGDEFAVLVENTTLAEVESLARRLIDVIRLPIALLGKEVVVSGSLGIAAGDQATDTEALLRNADVAMYRAKAAGKGCYKVFRPEMHRAAVDRFDLEADLRRAIDNDEIVPYYQPIVALDSGGVVGVEVLARWRHPRRGVMNPCDFIGIAEDSGLVLPLGRAMLEKACRQVALWRAAYGAPLLACVNASVREIEHVQFVDGVSRSLEVSGLDPKALVLELTESLFLADLAATATKLARIRQLGVRLAIDDFGTGYSSLRYLRSLPIDVLKIDRSFIEGVTAGPEQSAVARAIVKLGATFGIETVAEGIERREQQEALYAMGVRIGQGYLFAPPLDARACGRFLGRMGRAAGAPKPD